MLSGVNRWTWYEDEDYTVTLEESEGLLFVHIEVYNFSKDIFLRIKQSWWELLFQCYLYGYEFLHTYTKNKKFADKMGTNELLTTLNFNGSEYSLVRWDLRWDEWV